MTPAAQHINPELIMAWLDGELPAAEQQAIAEHLKNCPDCTRVAADFRDCSAWLARWDVPPAPERIGHALERRLASSERTPHRHNRLAWISWTACAMLGVVFLIGLVILRPGDKEGFIGNSAISVGERNETRLKMEGTLVARATSQDSFRQGKQPGVAGGAAASGLVTETRLARKPLIARTVSLTLQVQDFAKARAALDLIIAAHHGYAAQMNVNTREGSSPEASAALRIPAQDLAATLADLRTLGRVETETQSGDEITQQYDDLVQRLKTAHEAEDRLRGILQQRTGSLGDVLQVEHSITDVRGEIEGMEAEQAGLEHRILFASVEFELTQQYKAQLGDRGTSISARLHNAAVAGLEHAEGIVSSMLLFFVEFGPAIVIWATLLGLPAFLVWRRYRRLSRQL